MHQVWTEWGSAAPWVAPSHCSPLSVCVLPSLCTDFWIPLIQDPRSRSKIRAQVPAWAGKEVFLLSLHTPPPSIINLVATNQGLSVGQTWGAPHPSANTHQRAKAPSTSTSRTGRAVTGNPNSLLFTKARRHGLPVHCFPFFFTLWSRQRKPLGGRVLTPSSVQGHGTRPLCQPGPGGLYSECPCVGHPGGAPTSDPHLSPHLQQRG